MRYAGSCGPSSIRTRLPTRMSCGLPMLSAVPLACRHLPRSLIHPGSEPGSRLCSGGVNSQKVDLDTPLHAHCACIFHQHVTSLPFLERCTHPKRSRFLQLRSRYAPRCRCSLVGPTACFAGPSPATRVWSLSSTAALSMAAHVLACAPCAAPHCAPAATPYTNCSLSDAPSPRVGCVGSRAARSKHALSPPPRHAPTRPSIHFTSSCATCCAPHHPPHCSSLCPQVSFTRA